MKNTQKHQKIDKKKVKVKAHGAKLKFVEDSGLTPCVYPSRAYL